MPQFDDAASFWDSRYAEEHYLFGTAPNAFLAREGWRLEPGWDALAVADDHDRDGRQDQQAEGGLVEMDAIYLPETQDTLVEEMGQRRPFTTVVPDVMLAEEADWFVAGEPLTFTYNGTTVEYQTWQSARMIEADRLTFLGTSRGLPVYASTEDVMEIREDWMDAREAAMTDDLDDILEENAELANELEDVQYLYVPLRATGCVFQTVRVVEQVRKK